MAAAAITMMTTATRIVVPIPLRANFNPEQVTNALFRDSNGNVFSLVVHPAMVAC